MGTLIVSNHRSAAASPQYQLPPSSSQHPGVHHIQHPEAFEPGADGWPCLVMDAPRCPRPWCSARKLQLRFPAFPLFIAQ